MPWTVTVPASVMLPVEAVTTRVPRPATSNAPVSVLRNVIRLTDDRLHAVSSRNMYSEHGFDARIGPDFGHVCQSLMVVWNWMPGSAEAHAAWPI